MLTDHVTPDRASKLLYADERAAQWLARYELLRKAMPNHPWPALMSDAILRDAVAEAARGKRSLDGFLPSLLTALQSLLVYPLDRLMETEAPESITVPTGNRIRLQYAPQNDYPDELTPPVLAVRLQELFGLTDTPKVAAGRVPVILHLLGPNYRAVQVTQDLRSFWATTYFQVRKDLKARYPRHAWPEDPLTAPPQAKGRPQK